MDTSSINEQITTAVAIEAKEGHLANYLVDRASAAGRELGETELREAIELFEGYVRSVPEFLSAAVESGRGTPVEEIMGQVLRAAVTYWDEADDLVPDELGLLGLLDDAYFTLRMLQRVSERLMAEAGLTLIADDITALDAVVRDILGEIAEVLDELVAISLSDTEIEVFVAKVAEFSGSFVVKSAQTSFTGLSVDALVEDRLSFTWDESLQDALVELLDQRGPGLGATLGTAGSSLADFRGELASVAGAVDELLGQSEPALDDVVRESMVALLSGSLAQRVLAGAALDRPFLARSVELVLDGAG